MTMIRGLFGGWVSSVINEKANKELRDAQLRDKPSQATPYFTLYNIWYMQTNSCFQVLYIRTMYNEHLALSPYGDLIGDCPRKQWL